MPFEEQFRDGDLIDTVSFTLLLLSALLAVGRRAMALVFGMSLVLPAVAAKWINHSRPDLVSPPSFLIPGGLFVLFVTAHLFWFIFRARKIDSEVLCAGIATWLMLGLIWAFAYTFIAQSNPNAFAFTVDLSSARSLTGSTAIYFSFITLATVGYGDLSMRPHACRICGQSRGSR